MLTLIEKLAILVYLAASLNAALISPDGVINVPKGFSIPGLLRDITGQNSNEVIRDPNLRGNHQGSAKTKSDALHFDDALGLRIMTTSIVPTMESFTQSPRKLLRKAPYARNTTSKMYPVLVLLESLSQNITRPTAATTTASITLPVPQTTTTTIAAPTTTTRRHKKKKKAMFNRIYSLLNLQLKTTLSAPSTIVATTPITTTTTTTATSTTTTRRTTTTRVLVEEPGFGAEDRITEDNDSFGSNQENEFLRFFSTPQTPFFK